MLTSITGKLLAVIHDFEADLGYSLGLDGLVLLELKKFFLGRSIDGSNVIDILSLQNNNVVQLNGGGDFKVVLDNRCIKTLEAKVRKPWVWNIWNRFHDICIETHDTKPNSKSSAFLKCKTDFWAYMFNHDNRIKELMVFNTKPMQDWFRVNYQSYNEKPAYNKEWVTYNRMVPEVDVRKYMVSIQP